MFSIERIAGAVVKVITASRATLLLRREVGAAHGFTATHVVVAAALMPAERTAVANWRASGMLTHGWTPALNTICDKRMMVASESGSAPGRLVIATWSIAW